jgi:hypothetical protein
MARADPVADRPLDLSLDVLTTSGHLSCVAHATDLLCAYPGTPWHVSSTLIRANRRGDSSASVRAAPAVPSAPSGCSPLSRYFESGEPPTGLPIVGARRCHAEGADSRKQ